MTFPQQRPRRLRKTPWSRALVQETHLQPSSFVAPMFVREGISSPVPLQLLEGHVQETCDSIVETASRHLDVGCHSALLFGIPEHKDETGSQAWNEHGIVQLAISRLKKEYGSELTVIADCCLDEFTSHGHCGVLAADGSVDNDATIELYARTAVSQAASGADIIAPSGMMDGQVLAIRNALDDAGFAMTPIMAYSAKYASHLYGPFREAANCAPGFGDRKGYQMDPANAREAIGEVLLDIEEGADICIVKPALWYLDVINRIRDVVSVPVAAYCVSGECAMIHEAAKKGIFADELQAVLEAHHGVARAGADIIITYYALEICQLLKSGYIE